MANLSHPSISQLLCYESNSLASWDQLSWWWGRWGVCIEGVPSGFILLRRLEKSCPICTDPSLPSSLSGFLSDEPEIGVLQNSCGISSFPEELLSDDSGSYFKSVILPRGFCASCPLPLEVQFILFLNSSYSGRSSSGFNSILVGFLRIIDLNLGLQYTHLHKTRDNNMQSPADHPEKPKEPEDSLYVTSLASILAGSISKFILHPIDTIKAKWQVSTSKINTLQDYSSGAVSDLIKKTYHNEGVPGFFRGVGISVLGSAFAFSAYMTTYEYAKKKLTAMKSFQGHESLCHLASGFIAEFASCSLWLPIDIIKERMQVQSELKLYKYDGAVDAVQKIRGTEGVIGLYRAFGATLMSFGPFSALFFMFYEKLKQLLCQNPKEPGVAMNVVTSTIASSVAALITNPLELAKLRMQIQRADKAVKSGQTHLKDTYFGYRNMFHGIYLIWKKEGLLALYRGSLLRVMFSAPMTTFSMTLTQIFKQKIKEYKRSE